MNPDLGIQQFIVQVILYDILQQFPLPVVQFRDAAVVFRQAVLQLCQFCYIRCLNLDYLCAVHFQLFFPEAPDLTVLQPEHQLTLVFIRLFRTGNVFQFLPHV